VINAQGYYCTTCEKVITQWKHSYYECQCTRVGIYADIPLPEHWTVRIDAPADAQEAAEEKKG
jgi:hypothetical protein